MIIGVENWLLMCSEIEPLAPLEVEIISNSPGKFTTLFSALGSSLTCMILQ